MRQIDVLAAFSMLFAASDSAQVSFHPIDHPKKVTIIGDFNHWNAPGIPLRLGKDGLTWETSLKLEPGVYKYAVVEDNQPGSDMHKNPLLLVITPPDYARLPAAKGDGIITESGVRHLPNKSDTTRINERTFELKIRTRKDDVRNVSVAVWQEDSEQKIYPLALTSSDPLFDYYQVKVVVSPTKEFSYRFLLDDGPGPRAYDADGLSQGILGRTPFKQDPLTYRNAIEPPTPGSKVVAR